MVESVCIVILSLVIGSLTGVVAGLLGVGGGSILLPVFRLVMGMSAIGSTATSMFTIIPTSLSGMIGHLRGKTCIPKVGIALGIGGACLSPVGVMLAQASPSWAIMVAAAAAIIYSSTTMFKKALAAPKRSGEPASDGKPSAAQAQTVGDPAGSLTFGVREVIIALLIGAAAGLASGYIGLGGGFLMVPLMISLLKMPMKLTSGTSLIAIMILATPATITQCALGNVDLLVGIAIACGSIPGALYGAKLNRRVPERTLRFLFAGFLLVAAILLVVKEALLLV